MIDDLEEKLVAFAEGKLDEETDTEIDALLFMFVEDLLDHDKRTDDATRDQIMAVVETHEPFRQMLIQQIETARFTHEVLIPNLRVLFAEGRLEVPNPLGLKRRTTASGTTGRLAGSDPF